MPATIAVDASQGNDFRVTIAGNRTLGNPANPMDGQKIVFQVTQGTGGGFTLSYGSGYEFSTGLPQPTLSTTAGKTDLLAFVYNADKGKWLLAAFVAGFSTDDRHPAEGHLPAVPVHQRTVQPGLLRRTVHGRGSVRGHHGRNLVRRLLVVGVPVRAVHGDAEVRAVAVYNGGRRDALVPSCRSDLRDADRRAVELRAAA